MTPDAAASTTTFELAFSFACGSSLPATARSCCAAAQRLVVLPRISAIWWAFPVVRIDRPMAERAVATNGRIGVVVAVESTLTPTRELLEQCVAAANSAAVLIESPCLDAWGLFEAGNVSGYVDRLVGHVRELAPRVDVVVARAAPSGFIAAASLKRQRAQCLPGRRSTGRQQAPRRSKRERRRWSSALPLWDQTGSAGDGAAGHLDSPVRSDPGAMTRRFEPVGTPAVGRLRASGPAP
jgi:hypothetical protein